MDVEASGTGLYQSYCTRDQQKPTSARIKLYQRTENLFPRTISNEKEVVELPLEKVKLPETTYETSVEYKGEYETSYEDDECNSKGVGEESGEENEGRNRG